MLQKSIFTKKMLIIGEIRRAWPRSCPGSPGAVSSVAGTCTGRPQATTKQKTQHTKHSMHPAANAVAGAQRRWWHRPRRLWPAFPASRPAPYAGTPSGPPFTAAIAVGRGGPRLTAALPPQMLSCVRLLPQMNLARLPCDRACRAARRCPRQYSC